MVVGHLGFGFPVPVAFFEDEVGPAERGEEEVVDFLEVFLVKFGLVGVDVALVDLFDEAESFLGNSFGFVEISGEFVAYG